MRMRQAGHVESMKRKKMRTRYWWENWRKKVLWRWSDRLGESEGYVLCWIRLAWDTDKNQVISNTTVRFWVPHNAENFLISWWAARFSRRTLLHVMPTNIVELIRHFSLVSQSLGYVVNVQDVELHTIKVIVEYPSKFILRVDEAWYEAMSLILRKKYRLSTRRRCKGE